MAKKRGMEVAARYFERMAELRRGSRIDTDYGGGLWM